MQWHLWVFRTLIKCYRWSSLDDQVSLLLSPIVLKSCVRAVSLCEVTFSLNLHAALMFLDVMKLSRHAMWYLASEACKSDKEPLTRICTSSAHLSPRCSQVSRTTSLSDKFPVPLSEVLHIVASFQRFGFLGSRSREKYFPQKKQCSFKSKFDGKEHRVTLFLIWLYFSSEERFALWRFIWCDEVYVDRQFGWLSYWLPE